MRLFRRPATPAKTRVAQTDARTVVESRNDTGRVCGTNCAVTCEKCGSVACRCECTPDCAMAPRALSSEPDAFPIEQHIVPLVYELKRLGPFTPCWSCEGHNNNAGKLHRVPSVWFYCDSVVHARLLTEGIEKLAIQKRLNARWHVVIAVAEPDNPDTLYKLEPAIEAASATNLDQLRADIRTIAENLNHCVLDAATTLAGQPA